jgi:uncharacterized PurR-regulated membrane protein YhhQ (DUF165 family)
MISRRAAKVFAYGFAAVLVLIGLGFFAADVPVTRMCRRDCWFNDLLNLLFGDRVAKILIGALFMVFAVMLIRLARGGPRKKD